MPRETDYPKRRTITVFQHSPQTFLSLSIPPRHHRHRPQKPFPHSCRFTIYISTRQRRPITYNNTRTPRSRKHNIQPSQILQETDIAWTLHLVVQ